MARIPLGLQSWQSDTPVTAERLVNMYAERAPATAKTPVHVKKIPGMQFFPTSGQVPASNQFAQAGTFWNDALYWVAGGQLFATDAAGVTNLIGTLPGPGPYTFGVNRDSLTVCDSETVWDYEPGAGTPFLEITDDLRTVGSPSFTNCAFVTQSRQRIIFGDTHSDQLAFTEPGQSRDPRGNLTNYFSAEAVDDDLQRAVTVVDDLIVFGETSIEIFYDSGATSDTFQRRGPSHIARGCIAKMSVAIGAESKDSGGKQVYWIGNDRVVYRLSGMTPIRISDHGFETFLRDGDISDAIGHFHEWDGHTFYTLTFPTKGGTWVYDVDTGLWHERETWGQTHWRAAFMVRLAARTIIGDLFSNQLLFFDRDLETAAGGISHWEMTLAPIQDGRNRYNLFHERLEVEMEAGVGVVNGQTATPEVMLDLSEDGGETWRTIIRELGPGAPGDRSHKLFYNQLGRSPSRTYRLRGTDPYKARIYNVYLQARPGVA